MKKNFKQTRGARNLSNKKNFTKGRKKKDPGVRSNSDLEPFTAQRTKRNRKSRRRKRRRNKTGVSPSGSDSSISPESISSVRKVIRERKKKKIRDVKGERDSQSKTPYTVKYTYTDTQQSILRRHYPDRELIFANSYDAVTGQYVYDLHAIALDKLERLARHSKVTLGDIPKRYTDPEASAPDLEVEPVPIYNRIAKSWRDNGKVVKHQLAYEDESSDGIQIYDDLDQPKDSWKHDHNRYVHTDDCVCLKCAVRKPSGEESPDLGLIPSDGPVTQLPTVTMVPNDDGVRPIVPVLFHSLYGLTAQGVVDSMVGGRCFAVSFVTNSIKGRVIPTEFGDYTYTQDKKFLNISFGPFGHERVSAQNWCWNKNSCYPVGNGNESHLIWTMYPVNAGLSSGTLMIFSFRLILRPMLYDPSVPLYSIEAGRTGIVDDSIVNVYVKKLNPTQDGIYETFKVWKKDIVNGFNIRGLFWADRCLGIDLDYKQVRIPLKLLAKAIKEQSGMEINAKSYKAIRSYLKAQCKASFYPDHNLAEYDLASSLPIMTIMVLTNIIKSEKSIETYFTTSLFKDVANHNRSVRLENWTRLLLFRKVCWTFALVAICIGAFTQGILVPLERFGIWAIPGLTVLSSMTLTLFLGGFLLVLMTESLSFIGGWLKRLKNDLPSVVYFTKIGVALFALVFSLAFAVVGQAFWYLNLGAGFMGLALLIYTFPFASASLTDTIPEEPGLLLVPILVIVIICVLLLVCRKIGSRTDKFAAWLAFKEHVNNLRICLPLEGAAIQMDGLLEVDSLFDVSGIDTDSELKLTKVRPFKPRRIGVMVIGPVFSTTVPIVHRSSPLNERIAAISRVIKTQNRGSEELWKLWDDLAYEFIDIREEDGFPYSPTEYYYQGELHIQPVNLTWEYYISRFDTMRKNRLIREREKHLRGRTSKRSFAYQAFIKKEKIIGKATKRAYKPAKPRVIQGCSGFVKVVFGVWFLTYQYALKAAWNIKNRIWFTCGATSDDFNYRLRLQHDWAGPRPFYISCDFTEFDSTQGEYCMKSEISWYEFLGILKRQFGAGLLKSRAKVMVYMKSWYYELLWRRRSGDPDTSSGNSRITAISILLALIVVLGPAVIKSYSINCIGDDSFTVIDGRLIEDGFAKALESVISKLGLKLKIICGYDLAKMEYVSCRYFYTTDGWAIGKKPGRVLCKTGWFIAKQFKSKYWLQVFKGCLISYRPTTNHVPFLRVYVNECIKRIGLKPRFIDDRYRLKGTKIYHVSEQSWPIFRRVYGVGKSEEEVFACSFRRKLDRFGLCCLINDPFVDMLVAVDTAM